VIISDIFDGFRRKRFSFLWRGDRDGFGARDFHSRCGGHANTLTVILDTDGNILGASLRWSGTLETRRRPMRPESHPTGNCFKASLKSFLFTLQNPCTIPALRFALKAEKKDEAIDCCFH
jgi:hypothetical protein